MSTDMLEINRSADVSVWNKNLSEGYQITLVNDSHREETCVFKSNMPSLYAIGLMVKGPV